MYCDIEIFFRTIYLRGFFSKKVILKISCWRILNWSFSIKTKRRLEEMSQRNHKMDKVFGICLEDILRSTDKFWFRRGLLPKVITKNRDGLDSGSFGFLNDCTLNHPLIVSRLRIRHYNILIIIHIFIRFAPQVLNGESGLCLW